MVTLITGVPGIGQVIGKNLTLGENITLATELYDIYLKMGYDNFKVFMKGYGANRRYAAFAANAMQEWHSQYGHMYMVFGAGQT